jgi:hypothetical protein
MTDTPDEQVRALAGDACEYCRLPEVTLVGLTPIGRATIMVLAINDSSQILLRQVLREELA